VQQKANAVNEDIMAWIDEYNKNTKQPENLGEMLLAMLAEARGGDDLDLETREAQKTAAHHAAEEAFWSELDKFFPGISRAGIAGELAVQWNDMIRIVIDTALERRDAK
jgi:hypothetical protein